MFRSINIELKLFEYFIEWKNIIIIIFHIRVPSTELLTLLDVAAIGDGGGGDDGSGGMVNQVFPLQPTFIYYIFCSLFFCLAIFSGVISSERFSIIALTMEICQYTRKMAPNGSTALYFHGNFVEQIFERRKFEFRSILVRFFVFLLAIPRICCPIQSGYVCETMMSYMISVRNQ